jgi:hypothetical protein
VEEIARAFGMTERSIWGAIRELRAGGMLKLRKKARRHHYWVDLDAPLLHPTIRGLTLRPVLADLREQAGPLADEICETGYENGLAAR